MQMDASRYAICLWPGLPELWHRGKWSGLPAAVVFAGSLNFLLVARFIYPEWLQPSLVKIACWVAVGVWIMIVARSINRLPQLLYPRAAAGTPDRYPQAQQMYLRSQWHECEAILAEMLEIDSRDSAALLMLASVYRKTERWEAAQMALETLGRLETADAWWQERELEARRLEEAIENKSENSLDQTESPPTEDTDAEAVKPTDCEDSPCEGDQMSANAA